MNLSTQWMCKPLFADKLAKFADELLLHGQKRLTFETQYFPGEGMSQPLHSTAATALHRWLLGFAKENGNQ